MRGKSGITDSDEIRRRIAEHGRWWHEIELAPGIVTPGDDSNRKKLPILEGLGLAEDLAGLRALDIGCSDGYFSFELERRGAEVVAVDFVPEEYTGFSVAKEILGSSVEYRMDNVYNLDPEQYGFFDIVFFLGVLYHLRKPQAALDAIRSVMQPGAQLFVATFLIDEHVLLPDGSVTSLQELNPMSVTSAAERAAQARARDRFRDGARGRAGDRFRGGVRVLLFNFLTLIRAPAPDPAPCAARSAGCGYPSDRRD